MNTAIMTTLLTSQIVIYGEKLAIILGAFIGIGVAYLVFRFGWGVFKTSPDFSMLPHRNFKRPRREY